MVLLICALVAVIAASGTVLLYSLGGKELRTQEAREQAYQQATEDFCRRAVAVLSGQEGRR